VAADAAGLYAFLAVDHVVVGDLADGADSPTTGDAGADGVRIRMFLALHLGDPPLWEWSIFSSIIYPFLDDPF
jgi:hypothetical protein